MHSAVAATSTWQISPTPVRLNGLDKLRGIAAILVVLLHAGIPYMTNPLSYLAWPAKDAHPSSVVDGLTWCTECFLMPLFFVLAGFCSNGMLVSRGERCFLAGRTKRLLCTLVAAGLMILPICLYIWVLGWVADGLYVPQRFVIFGLPDELKAELFGVGHLWFLQYLYIYCLILCGASGLVKRFRMSGPVKKTGEPKAFCCLDRLLVSVWKPLIPAIPCALILYFDPRIVLGFYQTFFPVISKLLYYSIFFFVGVFIDRHRGALHLHARFGKTYLLLAGLIFTVTLPLIHSHMTVELSGMRLVRLAVLLALFAWFATFGLLAIFLRSGNRENAATRYLAEASFWVYLIHLPFVALTQIAVAQLQIPTIGKFLLTGSTALALALMTYQVIVRDTWLGQFLNGHRQPRNSMTDKLFSASNPGPAIAAGYADVERETVGVKRPLYGIRHNG